LAQVMMGFKEFCSLPIVHGPIDVTQIHNCLMNFLVLFLKLKVFFEGAPMDSILLVFKFNLCRVEMIHGSHHFFAIIVNWLNN
jgi:hypothetical protein